MAAFSFQKEFNDLLTKLQEKIQQVSHPSNILFLFLNVEKPSITQPHF